MDVETLRKICLSFPAATEDVKWGHDLCFSIGGKMFAVTSFEPPFGCSFKVPDEEYETLITRDGFVPAPYMARNKWVLVNKASALSRKEWEEYLRQSYTLVGAKLTKKVKKELGID